MKESVRRLVELFRGRRARGGAVFPQDEPPMLTEDSLLPTEEVFKSGLTVFDDLALRLRELTLRSDSDGIHDPTEAERLGNAFKVRIAKRAGFQRAAGAFVERRYSSRGYGAPESVQDPHLFTFVAYDEGRLVGTVSIRIDSEAGLGADDLYNEEIDVLREAGGKLCEFTRLAVHLDTVSKPVLASIFHTAYLYGSGVHGCTFLIMEVNPRHVPFYRRALGFEPIGPERLNRRVNAPAVLLCASCESISERLVQDGGKPVENHTRSLYPFAFGPDEERGILQRLKALETEGTGR